MKIVRIAILIGSLAVLGVAGAIVGMNYLDKKVVKADNRTPEAPEAVSSLGRIEPLDEIISVGGPAGTRIDQLLVKHGSKVQKDEPLAYLDGHKEMESARDQAQAMLADARKRYSAETNAGEATVAEAELAIEQARDVALLGIRAQEAEVQRSEIELKKVQLDLTRSQKMLDDRAIPKSQFDSVELTVRQAEQLLTRNRQMLSQMTRDREVKLKMTAAQLKSAQAQLIRAQLLPQVESMAAGLKLAEARLERTIIKAPTPGEVLKIMTRAGESVTGPILLLGDTSTMAVVAEVYETDIRHVQVGQSAQITTEALPGKTLEGTVERVNKLINKNELFNTDPTADADARVVEVRIRLQESALPAQLNNLRVNVKILVKK